MELALFPWTIMHETNLTQDKIRQHWLTGALMSKATERINRSPIIILQSRGLVDVVIPYRVKWATPQQVPPLYKK